MRLICQTGNPDFQIWRDVTQQNLLLSLIDNEFIDEGSKKDFVVVLTNSRGKVNPKNFYIVFLVSIDEKNQIRYNEVKRST